MAEKVGLTPEVIRDNILDILRGRTADDRIITFDTMVDQILAITNDYHQQQLRALVEDVEMAL